MMNSKQYIKKGLCENYNYSQDHCYVKLSSRDTNGELRLIEDTITIPQNMRHEALCKDAGKMLAIFKKVQFDVFLEELSKITAEDFTNKELMRSISAKFDINEE